MTLREPIYTVHRKTPLHPLEKWSIRMTSRMSREEVRKNFIGFFKSHSEVASPVLQRAVDDLHTTLSTDATRYNITNLTKPNVFFIPEKYKATILKYTNASDDLGGLYSPELHSIVVFTTQGGTDLVHARILAHEMKHAYSYHRSKIEILPPNSTDEHKTEMAMSSYRSGLSLHARDNRNYGGAFNELAAEFFAARYVRDTLSKWLPEEYEAYIERAKQFLARRPDLRGVFAPEEMVEYCDPKNGTPKATFTSYAENTRALTTVLSRLVPGGMEHLERACFTGNYMPLARAIEARFGKGSFRIFMTFHTESWDSEDAYTFALRDGNSRRLTKATKALLADRPHDYKKVFGELPKVKTKR